ncbi:MAG: DUF1934 family protein [Clostridiales bacterium]|nr:DUF1934 family protein [Clostridiales bacterium]
MEGSVQVRMTSRSTFGGQEDVLRFTGHGTVEKTDYGWHVHYTVQNTEDGASRMTSDVKLERESGRAVLVNEGETGYGMLLDPAVPTVTEIREGGKTLALNVATRQVAADLGGAREGSLTLDYMLMIGMQPLSALRVTIQFKKEESVK